MDFIAKRYLSLTYWKRYLSWRYWLDQYRLGNSHYDKVLKEILPGDIHYKYTKRNQYLKRFLVSPCLLITAFDSIFPGKLSIFISYPSTLIFYTGLFFLCFWELFISTYTFPNWKKFIVRNSPVHELAATMVLAKMTKNPIVSFCILCGGSIITSNQLYKELYPNEISPGERLGKYIDSKIEENFSLKKNKFN